MSTKKVRRFAPRPQVRLMAQKALIELEWIDTHMLPRRNDYLLEAVEHIGELEAILLKLAGTTPAAAV